MEKQLILSKKLWNSSLLGIIFMNESYNLKTKHHGRIKPKNTGKRKEKN